MPDRLRAQSFRQVLAGVLLLTGIGMGIGCLSPASAQSAEEFYRGKVLHLIVGSDVSGEYDATARLLAPGVNLPCCQPPLSQLGGHLVGQHTGTSLATAFVAGAILLLCESTGHEATMCLDALLRTADNRVISLDRAADYLATLPLPC